MQAYKPILTGKIKNAQYMEYNFYKLIRLNN